MHWITYIVYDQRENLCGIHPISVKRISYSSQRSTFNLTHFLFGDFVNLDITHNIRVYVYHTRAKSIA